MFSRKISNNEAASLGLITATCESADTAIWAFGFSGRSSALLIVHRNSVFYVLDRMVDRMSDAYFSKEQTDARDALIIAETARMARRGRLTRQPKPCRVRDASDVASAAVEAIQSQQAALSGEM